MTPPLTKHHQETYAAIFQHPIAHNIHRADVIALLGEISVVTTERNGNTKATRNGQTLVLHASLDKNISATAELMKIRRFLESSDNSHPPAAAAPAAPSDDAGHILVVVDHREARIYQTELTGTTPARITPFDPHGFGRTLRNVEDNADGKRKPETKSFYESIAKTLQNARQILLFGSSTGAASAMEQLLADLKLHHPDLAQRVVGSVHVDAQHLTEDQLLAQARTFYAKREPVVA
jgi:hypothetical protein